MKRYLVKRLLLMVITFLGISMISYLIIRLAPGDYSSLKAGMQGGLQAGTLSKEAVEAEKKLFGLDKGIVHGYTEWMGKFVRLDFGVSMVDKRPVIEKIKEALPITLMLNVISLIIMYIISIPLGIVSAVKKDTLFDRLNALILFILYSLPSFWIGLLLLKYFSGGDFFNVFPLGGYISDWAQDAPFFFKLGNVAWHLVLPIITLTYGSFAFMSRFVRTNLLEVINQQYITTARAKGLSGFRVIMIHAFRNSLIPLVTLMAALLPALLGGSIIVESIFSIPGMGQLSLKAIYTRDIPVVMAVLSFSALLTLIGILLSDIMYAVVDPRIRLEAKL